MASDDVIELGSSDDEPVEPATKKVFTYLFYFNILCYFVNDEIINTFMFKKNL